MKFLLFFIIVFFPFGSVFASELSLSTLTDDVGVGDVFYLTVVLDTQGENINAFSADIVFDKKNVEIESIYDNSGVVSFWIDKPKERLDGIISFSGILPGGINSSEVKLFTLALKATELGDSLFSFQNSRVLLHDGLGTDTNVRYRDLLLNITNLTNQLPISLDIQPPDFFDPVIINDSKYFNGLYAIYFSARDDNSGVQAYYIKEYKYWWQFYFESWRLVESPYVLQDQSLSSVIKIKAVDGENNERIVSVQPQNSNNTDWFLVVLLVFVSFFIIIILRNKNNK